MADQRKSEDPFLTSLQKLDDELTCPVCSDHFTEPKVLPCLHFYCKTCIANLMKRAKGRPFSCPECRRETNAEGDNSENLPTAFFVNRMKELFSVMKKAERKDSVTCESCPRHLPAVDFCHDCSKYICTDCTEAHKLMYLLSSHRVVSIDSLRSTISKNPPEKLQVFSREVKCSKHKDEPLKLYCHDCSKLVCRDCIVIDHKDHEYAFVIDAAPLCKAEIQEKAESVKKITEGVKSAVISLGESRKKLSDHGIATTRAIDQAIDEIVAKLAEKRREMKEKASRIVSETEERIAAQEKNAQLAVGELVSLQEFMSHSLETETDQEILSLKKQVSDQVERVSKLYRDADRKFPVPELPELVVNCGERVNQAIETELSVAQRELEQKVAIVASFEEHEEDMAEGGRGESSVEGVEVLTATDGPFGAPRVVDSYGVGAPRVVGESSGAKVGVIDVPFGAPCVADSYGVGAPCVADSYTPCVADLYGADSYSVGAPCVADLYGVGAPCVADSYGVGAPCVADSYGVGAPCVADSYGVGAPCVADSYTPCVADLYGADSYSVGAPCVADLYGVGAPCVADSYSVGAPRVVGEAKVGVIDVPFGAGMGKSRGLRTEPGQVEPIWGRKSVQPQKAMRAPYQQKESASNGESLWSRSQLEGGAVAELTATAEPFDTPDEGGQDTGVEVVPLDRRTILQKHRVRSSVSRGPIEAKTISESTSHELSMSHGVPFPQQLNYKNLKRRSQRKY